MKKNYPHRIIKLTSVKNLRTLGGLPSTCGGTIRQGILYRSGAWDKLIPKEADFLHRDCGITLDIDLRTKAEVQMAPEREVEGVRYLYLPITPDTLPGISRELEPGKAITVDMLPDMAYIYREIVRQPQYIEAFSQVIHAIMNHRDGAVLWHCTAGKDRCGLTAFFLESILGVDRKTCMQDYMLTNRAYLLEAAKKSILAGAVKHNLALAKKVFSVYTVSRRFMNTSLEVIDTEFGGMDAYIRNQLKVTNEEKEAFRKYALQK